MLSLALEEGIKACMSHHLYSLDQAVLHQDRGGPIGLKLSGALAKAFMVHWCRRFGQTLRAATASIPLYKIHLHVFYVDDQGLVVPCLPPGSRYQEGEVRVVEEEVEGDLLLAGDRRTAMVRRDIANTISPNTTITVDYPSNHRSGWMPILDLHVRMEEGGVEGGGREVDWRFYKKEVSSPFFLLNRSAVSAKVKRAMLAQEGLRRLRNTKPSKVEEEKVHLLEEMSEMMMRSGYPETYREGVLCSVLTGYARQVEASQRGDKPLYRPREWHRVERRRAKQLKKASWYRPSDTVLFVPVTPNSELARRVREVVEEEGRRLGLGIRVVERGGPSLKSHLMRTDMSAGSPCPQEDCILCLTNPGEGGGLHHHRAGALYSGECLLCPREHGERFTALYLGESGASGYVRTGEHGKSIQRRDLGNAFAKHLADHHQEREGDVKTFLFKVLKTFRSSLYRQVWEAVKIHGNSATIILNSRSEWHQPLTERIVFTREVREQAPAVVGRRGGGVRRMRGGGN